MTYNGIINVYKEKDYTSHDVVAIVRKTLGRVKTGHTGTLDPMAEGVLPICVGKATKLTGYFQEGDKTYRAVMKLGIVTDTEDITGEVIDSGTRVINCRWDKNEDFDIDEEGVEKAVASFYGSYMQMPPMYSAVKINGKKLYTLARQGIEVERKARAVDIKRIEITKFLPESCVEIEVECSKGTYIRTLIKDIGEKLGCGACMAHLVRTEVCGFSSEDGITLSGLKELAEQGKTESIIMPMDKALKLPRVSVHEEYTGKLANGNSLGIDECKNSFEEGKLYFVYDSKDNLWGIHSGIYKDGNLYLKPRTMLGGVSQ